ncbi:MAG: tRNA (guanosine(37)-N1)-methyltransferase TrmD [Candidatus Dojkabacteria bacterium]|jgi:tRNA (guanine37-N1)-methyltransferase|nr:tRNA (guanosine(37)-N1)-methyltransferase TrmD [Candidatus Dojkabacteria bacterium]MDD2270263.1 tRNA (guanosine(37)-N1)-methyltransferase TrmD [Candidatus Dojkabacteria bacterium]
MKFDIITIFPNVIQEYISTGILRIAQEKALVEINIHDLRKWTEDKHKTVDDTPYGGGPGMVMKIEPIHKAIEELKTERSVVCITTPKGEKLTQSKVRELSENKNAHYIIICGRYEGVDQRVHDNLVDFEFSIGDYILSGGELAGLVLVDSITRLIPGVLGNSESLESESFTEKDKLDFPQYTKPEKFNNWQVPEVLLSGNHKDIKEWRKKHSTKL